MALDEWLERLSAELGVDDIVLDLAARQTVLDLARDAAHEVERPAAPLSTFVLGVAVGRGRSIDDAAATATALLLPSDAAEITTNTDGNADQAG